jgi:hypothetical protein
MKRKPGPEFLKVALLEVEAAFQERLRHTGRMVTHSVTLGDAVEEAWNDLLRTYLPARYQVAKAFAVDCEGHVTEQLDCLIYDAHFTPALFGRGSHLYVPAEAVYATFEVKQTVNRNNLFAAGSKVESVRRLRRTSAPVPWLSGVGPPKIPSPILGGLLAMDGKLRSGMMAAHQLDMVLTAESGFYDRFSADGSLTAGSGPGSLMRGLFRLLAALRERATVVAVEWDQYEGVLK